MGINMSEIQLNNPSGIECLRRIFTQFRHNVNYDALITDELRERCKTEEADVIMELANNHDLRAEKHTDITEISKTYNGPALLKQAGLRPAGTLCGSKRQQR